MTTGTTIPFEIIVISLATSSDRRAQAAEQLHTTQFSWSFQDAVHGAALAAFPEEYDRRKRLRFWGRDMIPGQIGCFLSHRQVWKKCVQTQKLTLVLEDDFAFQQNLSEVLPIVFASLPHCDVLRLQGLQTDRKYKVLKDYGKNQLVKHYKDTFGTTAYFVKPESAKVLLEKSQRFHAHVDDFFSHDWIHRLNIISILPYPVKPSGLKSTIGVDMQNAKLSLAEKCLTKIRKLSRSIEKRIYRIQTRSVQFSKEADNISHGK
jgi:glycosyl transferase family 25